MNITVKGQNNKETVIFIHDLGNNQSSFYYEQDALSNDYKTIAYDLIGHGENKETDFSLDNLSKQLNEVFKESNTEKAHLVSFGFGHYIAIHFAKQYQDKVLSLNTVGGIGHYKEAEMFNNMRNLLEMNVSEAEWRKEYSEYTLPKIEKFYEHPEISAYLSSEIDVEVLKQGVQQIVSYNIEAFLKDTNIPILWVMGNHDNYYLDTLNFLPDNQAILFTYLPDVAHMAHLQNHDLFTYFLDTTFKSFKEV